MAFLDLCAVINQINEEFVRVREKILQLTLLSTQSKTMYHKDEEAEALE